MCDDCCILLNWQLLIVLLFWTLDETRFSRSSFMLQRIAGVSARLATSVVIERHKCGHLSRVPSADGSTLLILAFRSSYSPDRLISQPQLATFRRGSQQLGRRIHKPRFIVWLCCELYARNESQIIPLNNGKLKGMLTSEPARQEANNGSRLAMNGHVAVCVAV